MTGQTKRLDVVVGTTFGRWTVEGEAPPALRSCGTTRRVLQVRCACGKAAVVRLEGLTSGQSTSCGCYRREVLRSANTKHGHALADAHSREYNSWTNMVRRCTNMRSDPYSRHGGRGITACDRWRNSFENFLADMGPRPSQQHSIDRIDNDGHYQSGHGPAFGPGNCRWATASEQARNRRPRMKA